MPWFDRCCGQSSSTSGPLSIMRSHRALLSVSWMNWVLPQGLCIFFCIGWCWPFSAVTGPLASVSSYLSFFYVNKSFLTTPFFLKNACPLPHLLHALSVSFSDHLSLFVIALCVYFCVCVWLLLYVENSMRVEIISI